MTSSLPFAGMSPDVVMDAVESLGYLCDARILELNSYENRVYQVGIEDSDPVIAKFYRAGRWTDAQILEEHQYTLDLLDADVTAVPPLTVNETTLHTFHDFRFTLYPRRGGRAPAVDNLDSLEILGRYIGRIHRVGSTASFTARPHLSLDEFGYQARDFLLENDFIPVELLDAYSSVADGLLNDLASLWDDGLRQIRLHGDCHMGNVLMRENTPHFVDFDDARTGPAIQDLWMMLSGDYETQSNQMRRILLGYRDFYDFDLAELRLIEPLRTMRMMYHAAWLARRWDDPAFPRAFPFFNTQRYWSEHILELREQWSRLSEPVPTVYF